MNEEKPAVFIASSAEGLAEAEAINANLDHATHPTLWRIGTFDLGSVTIDALVKKSSVVDFAIFVFTPDDVATIRKQDQKIARDNVVFELGLFIGAIGKDRCYIIRPRGVDMHLPSDLLGITTADYVPNRPDGDIASALNYACKLIKDAIDKAGPLDRAKAAPNPPRRHTANPAEYELHRADFLVLGECMRSNFYSPGGIGFHQIIDALKRESHASLMVSAAKLMKLGLIEKSIEEGDNDYRYYAYHATEDGVEMFVKSEREYRPPSPIPAPPPRKPVPSGFNDMDDDIPF